MTKLLWKARYALILANRTGMRLPMAWGCAASAWDDNLIFPTTPSESVENELSCWGD